MLRPLIGAVVLLIAVLGVIYFTGEGTVQPQPTAAQTTSEATSHSSDTGADDKDIGETAMASQSQGDAAEGKALFRKKCMTCHTVDKGGANRTGPNLWGIVGRTKAAAQNFRYSKTMKMMGGVWTPHEISSFIAGPRTFVPDTKMVFAGLKKERDRTNILTYLKTLTD